MIKRLRTSIKRQFFTGVVVLLPLGLTLYIAWVLFNLVGRLFLPLVEKFSLLYRYDVPPFVNRVVSFVITLIIIWLIGLVAANIVGRKLLKLAEVLIFRVPLLDRIYQAVRQIIHAMVFSKTAFRRVVLVEYPRKGLYTLAFVSNSSEIEDKEKGKKKILTLFLPTTPNPTSGWFLIVPEEETIPLELSIEEGMKLLISGGVITPERFFDKLEIGRK